MADQTQHMNTQGERISPLQEQWKEFSERLAHGDIGSLPVILGLIVIAIIFQLANPNFLTPLNLTNLMVQISSMGTMSVGIVLVLLLGEIDLSVGAVSGFCAAIMAVLSVQFGLPGIAAILVGILVGAAVGLLQGWWFAKLHVPSFVVTLAGFIGWTGALLYVLGSTGTVNLNDMLIIGLANTLLPVWLGWVIAILFIIFFALNSLIERQRRARLGLENSSTTLFVVRLVIVSVFTILAVGVMNIDRNPSHTIFVGGVPTAVLFLIGFVILFDFITRRTKFGRYIFAVGGNAEAARRAGINVDMIRIIVFILCSTLAACGGILAASRLYAVNQSSGSGDVLLNAIAAAVIGGTSLFGGRGSTWSALLGALVIGSIANGMDLLALASSIRFMVTGAVLLLAVTLDAYTRSRREMTGR
jgi:D-xylose transport system permease protein